MFLTGMPIEFNLMQSAQACIGLVQKRFSI